MVDSSATKEARICNGEKAVPSVSAAGETGQPHVEKKWNIPS